MTTDSIWLLGGHRKALTDRFASWFHPITRESASSSQPQPSGAQPLYEALAIGLGCESFDYRMPDLPEWR